MISHRLSLTQPISALSLRVLTTLLLLLLSACGGGSGSSGPSNKITILSQPEGIAVLEGEAIELSVQAESNLYLRYQWYRNNVPLVAKTTANLRITRASLSDAGSYHVEVKGTSGQIQKSDVALVEVNERQDPPSIVSGPATVERAKGDETEFSVTAKGLSPLIYQWRKNGVDIPGETASKLKITSLDYDDAGSYSVFISNPLGTKTSDPAELTIVKQRATGIWYGMIDDETLGHMIVPPSGEMLLLQFGNNPVDDDPGSFSGLYLGQVRTTEGRFSGTLSVAPDSANRMQFFGADAPVGNYFLRIPRFPSSFAYRSNLEVRLELYENVSDTFQASSSPMSSFKAIYQATASERSTPLNSLAATWRYFSEGSTEDPIISITLNASGKVMAGSYEGDECKLSGQLVAVEGSTSLFSATLLYANKGGKVCSKVGFQYQGYVFIASGAAGDTLAWYLYLKNSDDIVGFSYLPLKQ